MTTGTVEERMPKVTLFTTLSGITLDVRQDTGCGDLRRTTT
jgi:hypothetical protein